MLFDVTALGEILIDFTPCGESEAGRNLFEQNPGGAPANVLVALQRLGLHTAFIGKIGDDMHGRLLRHTLEDERVDTRGMITDPDYFTTLAFVSLDNGERSFSFARKPGADTQLRKDEVNKDILDNTYIFHFGSLSLTDEPARSATIYAVEEAKKAGAIISYDPNYRAPLWPDEETAKKEMRSVIPYVNLMKISDEETELLTGEKDPEKAADRLLDQGVACVVVTLGKKGALMKTKEFLAYNNVPVRRVVDTTGAGDSFWGGMLACFSRNHTKPDAITEEDAEQYLRFANTVAGLCIEKRGGIPSMPKLETVMEELNSMETRSTQKPW